MVSNMPEYAQIREELEAKLQELVRRAKQIDDDLREPGDEDWEERAVEHENDDVLESLGAETVREIQQIKEALHQIDHGTYGTCRRCGAAIPAGRLEALPFATTCTKCA